MSAENTENDLVKGIDTIFENANKITQQATEDVRTMNATLQPSPLNPANGNVGVPFLSILHSKKDLHHENLKNECEEQLQFITEHKHQLNELQNVVKKIKEEVQDEEQNLDKIKNKIEKYDGKFLELAKEKRILTAYKTLTSVTFSNTNSSAFKGYIERKETSDMEVIFNEEEDENEKVVNNTWNKIEKMYM